MVEESKICSTWETFFAKETMERLSERYQKVVSDTISSLHFCQIQKFHQIDGSTKDELKLERRIYASKLSNLGL